MAAAWHPWTYTSDDDKSKQVPLPHRPRTWLALSTSVPALDSPLPLLHRNRARPCHICTGSRLMLGARFASQRLCCIASLAAVAGAFQVATGLRDWRRGGLRRGRVFFRSVGTRCATRKTTSPSSPSKVRTHTHVRAWMQLPSSRGRPVAPARFGLQAGDMRCQRRRLWRRLSCCAGWLLASRFSGLAQCRPERPSLPMRSMRGFSLSPT